MIKIRVEPGGEVMKTLTAEVQAKGISDAAIVSLVGAVDEFCISNMPKEDAKQDILTEYTQPGELSGTGAINGGKVHIHVVLGQQDHSTLSGHLHWAKVNTWFVEAYILPLD